MKMTTLSFSERFLNDFVSQIDDYDIQHQTDQQFAKEKSKEQLARIRSIIEQQHLQLGKMKNMADFIVIQHNGYEERSCTSSPTRHQKELDELIIEHEILEKKEMADYDTINALYKLYESIINRMISSRPGMRKDIFINPGMRKDVFINYLPTRIR